MSVLSYHTAAPVKLQSKSCYCVVLNLKELLTCLLLNVYIVDNNCALQATHSLCMHTVDGLLDRHLPRRHAGCLCN